MLLRFCSLLICNWKGTLAPAFFNDCITYFAHTKVCSFDSFAIKWCKFESTKPCRCNKCQWQIIFKTVKFSVYSLYFVPIFLKKVRKCFSVVHFLFTYHYSLNLARCLKALNVSTNEATTATEESKARKDRHQLDAFTLGCSCEK